ncbi:hypothetical protein DSCO28_03310 [Desulfosarcina ovata subsp. sediminis]|uniref:Uncharacterized protein n=1 Tax=Desulfosarcina ovata subsp. sediminis TaxID=885957 RepID=A0A5K7ZHM3_9BACT|nr:hypothetical protein [Desulfosarcina ovata]BBO79765.1 hypothetical protein DSCO28_03310 [Desulfosarcina ovata subsp. sediminis]
MDTKPDGLKIPVTNPALFVEQLTIDLLHAVIVNPAITILSKANIPYAGRHAATLMRIMMDFKHYGILSGPAEICRDAYPFAEG